MHYRTGPSTQHWAILTCASTMALAACTTGPAPGNSTPTTTPSSATIVATTTQLGSIVTDITTCAGGTTATLMGPGDDPHEFALSSAQVAELVRADLVVANGLGLEESLDGALSNAVADGGTLYEVAPNLEPLSYSDPATDEDDHEADDGHDHGPTDPHVLLDAGRAATAAELIGTRIAEITGEDDYLTCAADVATQLRATDSQVRDTLATIPEDRRILITDHEAYNYFAQAYDFRVAGVVIPGGGTDAQPSSAELASLAGVIDRADVHALFSNNALSPQVLESLAAEVGGDVAVVQLYTGSLGEPGSGAETYSGMMLTNAQRIADALAEE
ncbi:MAG: metal ABC transporter solute-binding protein, Zn/Mn family [Propioniciclava sp.]